MPESKSKPKASVDASAKPSKKSSSNSFSRIDTLVSQLDDIAKAQVEFMTFFPPLADQISLGLADYLGEVGCVKLSNNVEDFSFDDDYGHEGLGVESGCFRIPLMVRIRDHSSCPDAEQIEAEDQSETPSKKAKPKKKAAGKITKKPATVKAAAVKRKKAKKSKVDDSLEASSKAKKSSKTKKTKKSLKKTKKKLKQEAALTEKDHTASDCSETFLRFKLLFERKEDHLIVNIAGTKKITVDAEDFEPLYEAIFVYLKKYFSVEKFFDKGTKSYQNASYGFFRTHF